MRYTLVVSRVKGKKLTDHSIQERRLPAYPVMSMNSSIKQREGGVEIPQEARVSVDCISAHDSHREQSLGFIQSQVTERHGIASISLAV